MNLIVFLKRIDAFWGRILINVMPELKGTILGACEKILLIRPGGIGDAVLLAPTIRALKRQFPNAIIDVLAEKRNGGIFSLTKDVRKIFFYDRPKELWAATREKYDVIIDTEQWHRLSAVVARLAGKGATVGFATNERKRAFSHPVPYSHEDYEAVSFLRLLQPFGVDPCPDAISLPFLDLPLKAVQSAQEFLAVMEGTPFVVIFPGASIPERRWGAANFRSVAVVLSNEGIPSVVVGGLGDVTDAAEILDGLLGLNLAGRTSLAETAAVIERSLLLISGDSGVLHLGVGLDKPTVSLFGPGIASKWAPQGEDHIVLNRGLECSPCTRFGYTPQCPLGAACLKEITPAEVIEAVLGLWRNMKSEERGV